MIPPHEWWNIIHNYGFTIFPAQIVFYLKAIGTLVMFFRRPGETADRVIKGFIALSFSWIGIVFFFCSDRNSRCTMHSLFCSYHFP